MRTSAAIRPWPSTNWVANLANGQPAQPAVTIWSCSDGPSSSEPIEAGPLRTAAICPGASPNGGTAYPTSTAWDESTTSWSSAPPATGGALGSVGSVAAGAWADFDVTSLVSGNGQVDVLIADGDTNSAYYSSREGTAAPQLVVTTSP